MRSVKQLVQVYSKNIIFIFNKIRYFAKIPLDCVTLL